MHGIRLLKNVLALALLLSIVGCTETSEPPPDPPQPVAAEPQHPEVFVKTAFETALAENETNGKLLFVDVVTSWCVPCKEMDKTTWLDEGLAEWFAENTVAIKIDTGDDVQFRLDHKIMKWPTFLVFKDGKEIARDETGFKTAEEMVAWLEKELEDAEEKG